MEPSFLGTPYLKATSTDSRAIRELLDQQEAEYEVWRSNRKPIRHPFATPKLNSPLKCVHQERTETATKPLWLALLHRDEHQAPQEESRPKSTASLAADERARRRGSLASSVVSGRSTPLTSLKSPASTAQLPALRSNSTNRTAPSTTTRLATTASLVSLNQRSDETNAPRRKKPSAAKRKLQRNLYDFHSSIVFSIADDETQPSQRERDEPKAPQQSEPPPESPVTHEDHTPDVVIIELPPPEDDVEPYVVGGLHVVNATIFDNIFEHDFDRLVRDAVERKRIYVILKKWYRVVVLYFRQCSGKAALAMSYNSTVKNLDLMQIPNRLSLLEDLNVQCVDPAKFGLTETPLRRDGLITFLLQTARMVAAHPAQPSLFRMFAMEGIELSEAVRSLMVDHLAVYCQIQDTNHFRDIFLLDHHDRQGRRLRHILNKYDSSLSSFFFEILTANAMQERQRGKPQTSTATTMSFPAFVSALKVTGVIMPETVASRRRSTQIQSKDGDASTAAAASVAPVSLDESRTMRIFQLCLDVGAELHSRVGSAGGGLLSTKQHLAFPQFVEALLRVALLRKEQAICRGGVDICPDQQTSEVCRCRLQLPDYDLNAFDEAIEELFSAIHSHRMKQTTRRSSKATLASSGRLQLQVGQRMSGGLPRHALIIEPEDEDEDEDDDEDEKDDDDETI